MAYAIVSFFTSHSMWIYVSKITYGKIEHAFLLWTLISDISLCREIYLRPIIVHLIYFGIFHFDRWKCSCYASSKSHNASQFIVHAFFPNIDTGIKWWQDIRNTLNIILDIFVVAVTSSNRMVSIYLWHGPRKY